MRKVILKMYSSERKKRIYLSVKDEKEDLLECQFHDFRIVESTNCPHLIPGESFRIKANKYPEDLWEVVTGDKGPEMRRGVEIVLREEE